MKHILNEMNDEERNSIRSQYTGTLSVQTGKFKQLVENKLGNAKPLVEQYESFTAFDEQEDEPSTEDMPLEPMDDQEDGPSTEDMPLEPMDEDYDDEDYGNEEGEEASWMNESDDATLKEKIEKAIRNSVTNKEEIIDVLEKILREKKGVGYVTKDKVLKNFKK
jgi:hypothetical protein